MFQANLPLTFWSNCVLTKAHIINSISTPLLKKKKKHILKGYFTNHRIFLILKFLTDYPLHLHLLITDKRFDPMDTECLCLGYPSNVKGIKLTNLNTN